MSLVVFFFILLYLAVLVGATVLGYQWAKWRGWPPGKRWSAAAVGFLVIFLPMFWDWMPTVWLHSYYCEKYAGLTVSKTPEQWKKENPGVAESLVRQDPPKQIGSEQAYYMQLNQRFRREAQRSEKPLWLIERQNRTVDSKTGELMVRLINFSTGQSGRIEEFRDIKIWMKRGSCKREGQAIRRKEFGQLSHRFGTLGGSQ